MQSKIKKQPPKQTRPKASATVADPRWQAIKKRDKQADGQFVYAVKTTGIYCRPSCGARLPLPENIAFYTTPQTAQQAGFRPCKRCKPDAQTFSHPHAELVARLCTYMEQAENAPTLQELANIAQLSSFHLQRVFKRLTGLTPKAYAIAHRAQKMRNQLATRDSGSCMVKHSLSMTQTMYHAGFNNSSRFYETSSEILGMKPEAYRNGGTDSHIHFAIAECSLGSILVAASQKGICAISIGDDPEALVQELQDRFPKASLTGNDPEFDRTVAKVVAFVEMPEAGLDLPLDIRGTAFQKRVWHVLRQIPVGTTASYAEVAKRMGSPKAFRAVASACAANVLAVLIPCHRVIRNDGHLSGYRWGIDRKRALILKEAKQEKKMPSDMDLKAKHHR